jgi:hypothetical protein
MEKDMGASSRNGLGAPEGAEPPSRLGASPAIPSAGDPMAYASALFGRRVKRLEVPGYEMAQRITVGFGDGTSVTVWGSNPAAAWGQLRKVAAESQ